MNLDDLDLTPTAGMVAEAKRGLAWRSDLNRGGTAVGIARARDIANGKALSPETVMRMASFFARHEVDKKGKGFTPGDGFPSNGRIAWALWGGDAGASWSRKMSDQIKRARTAAVVDRRVASILPLEGPPLDPRLAALRFPRALTPAQLQQRRMAAKAAAEKRRRLAQQNRSVLEQRRAELRRQTQGMAKQRKVARQQLKASRPKNWVREAAKNAGRGITEDFKVAGELLTGEAQIVPLETSKKKRVARIASLSVERVREIALLARNGY